MAPCVRPPEFVRHEISRHLVYVCSLRARTLSIQPDQVGNRYALRPFLPALRRTRKAILKLGTSIYLVLYAVAD